ncbi:hypothetical protein OOT46_02960 [Aquabacterium sp. A7-Y]|uniref:hypothetical protein n=1 Tax=Aquabacterium sp. A7-Y TaxID=1349605 RepID=UPI00223E23BD|nr:hypothetical protein [Aquabacterium sp. A7-Y]MCW7536814.1 hypothetical protein [Aquabacterium sp. A7-Y]
MRKIASATLARQHLRERLCTVELIELDLPEGQVGSARYIVAVRQELRESSLTAVPCTLVEAERRALDFLQRRLAAGERLVRRHGFDAIESVQLPPTVVTPPPRAATQPVPRQMAALVARFQPAQWKLQSPERRARAAWRVAECSDPSDAAAASHHALRSLVPRLVELLESGNDLLDLCLAAAIGRLGDPGAAEAMQALSQRGRSPATRRVAHQAWLMLLAPESLQAYAAGLSSQWQNELASTETGEALVARLDGALDARKLSWAQLLQEWYDIALVQPNVRAVMLGLLKALPLEADCFQAIRYVYKAAELRRDAEVVGLLHARFENTPGGHGAATGRRYRSPATGGWIARVKGGARAPATAYGPRTREYLRLRGWRTLRRLAAIGHSHAPELAVNLLLGLVDEEQAAAREEHRWGQVDGRYQRMLRLHHAGAGWLLVPKVLLPELPGLQTSTRAKRWWTLQPIDVTRAMPQRTEGLRAMWDAHPEALLRLAMESRSALVHAVVARALQDHAAFVRRQDVPVLKALLRSAYAPTASIGFDAARARIEEAIRDTAAQVPWLKLMAASSHAAAHDFALLHIAGDPAAFARHADLVVSLLLSAQERARRQGHGLALLAPPQELFAELQSALLASDPAAPGLAEGACLAERLLTEPLAVAAAGAVLQSLGSLLPLLDHPSAAVAQVGVTWLLLQPAGVAMLPPPLLTRLLASDDPDRRACGARLLAALPDDVLRKQIDLLGDMAVHAHAGIRAAIAPALLRVAASDPAFAHALAARLHQTLFHAEPGEGVHDDALRWLTHELAPHAPARDRSGTWRALQARSRGAQRYGAWALALRKSADYSLKQQATLARHVEAGVRQWAMRAIDATLPATPTPEQSAELLPLAETAFDDTRAYAQSLFGERLPDESLSVELLIAWVDHPQAWVQALGRSRLVRRMSAADASLCLTRLSQHPGAQVQLFVTQWLLELPTDDPARLAQQLRALKPYFLTVLSQVHRGRVAKSRITEFLRAQTQAVDTAVVVAEIFARQVVTASRTDKPQYIAGLRDIAARHPQIELPFMAWKTPAVHTA